MGIFGAIFRGLCGITYVYKGICCRRSFFWAQRFLKINNHFFPIGFLGVSEWLDIKLKSYWLRAKEQRSNWKTQ